MALNEAHKKLVAFAEGLGSKIADPAYFSVLAAAFPVGVLPSEELLALQSKIVRYGKDAQILDTCLKNGRADLASIIWGRLSDSSKRDLPSNAAREDRVDLMRGLLERDPRLATRSHRSPAGESLLHLAKSPEMVALLMSKGATIDQLGPYEPGNPDAVKALLERGLSPTHDAAAGYGSYSSVRSPTSLFHGAAALGATGSMAHLLDRGVDINQVDRRGNTALMLVLNILSTNGASLFHETTREQRLASARFFIERGANLSVLNEGGQTARQIAEANGFGEIVDLIDARLAEAPTPVATREAATGPGRLPEVGASAPAAPRQSQSPTSALQVLMKRSAPSLEAVHRLVEQGAELDRQLPDRTTLLDSVAKYCIGKVATEAAAPAGPEKDARRLMLNDLGERLEAHAGGAGKVTLAAALRAAVSRL